MSGALYNSEIELKNSTRGRGVGLKYVFNRRDSIRKFSARRREVGFKCDLEQNHYEDYDSNPSSSATSSGGSGVNSQPQYRYGDSSRTTLWYSGSFSSRRRHSSRPSASQLPFFSTAYLLSALLRGRRSPSLLSSFIIRLPSQRMDNSIPDNYIVSMQSALQDSYRGLYGPGE